MDSTRKDLNAKLLMEAKEDQQDGQEKPALLLPSNNNISTSPNVFEELFIQDADLRKQIKKEIRFFISQFKKIMADKQSGNQIHSDPDKVKALTNLIKVLPDFKNQLIKDLETKKLTELKVWSVKESAARIFRGIINNKLQEEDIENFKKITEVLKSSAQWRTIIGIILGAAIAIAVKIALVVSGVGAPIAATIGAGLGSMLFGGLVGFFSTKNYITKSVEDNAKALRVSAGGKSVVSDNADPLLPPEIEAFRSDFIKQLESVIAKEQKNNAGRYKKFTSFFGSLFAREGGEVMEALLLVLQTVKEKAFFLNNEWLSHLNNALEFIHERACAIKDLNEHSRVAGYCVDLIGIIGDFWRQETVKEKLKAVKGLRDSLNLGSSSNWLIDKLIKKAEKANDPRYALEFLESCENYMRTNTYKVHVDKLLKSNELPEKCDVVVIPSDDTIYRINYPRIEQFKESEGIRDRYNFSVTAEQLQRLISMLEKESLMIVSPTPRAECEQNESGQVTSFLASRVSKK